MKKSGLVIAILILIVIAIFGVKLFINYHRTFVYLDGPGMEPTIHSGQEVRLHPYAKGQTPRRGDIVEHTITSKLAKQYSSSGQFIHRIIALPGERIAINNNQVLVYNAQQPQGFNPDTYLAPNVVTAGTVDMTLSPGMYFVMGDNRAYSFDSRATGPIPLSDITGKITTQLPFFLSKK